jgi:adenosylcobinamide-GDP ribazoletransferase
MIDLAREAKLLIYATQMLTRLPMPALGPPEPDALARSAKYFPLVGIQVGTIAASILLLSSLGLKGALPALLAVGGGVFVTGAFHEDGLADAADGLGGGATRVRRLAIMKDSRIGTYGVLALALVMAIKVAALVEIEPTISAAIALVAAHTAGRVGPVVVMARLRYAGDPTIAKLPLGPVQVTVREALVAAALAAPSLALMGPIPALTGLGCGAAAAVAMALLARKLIGGYTGDILGAVEQVFEAGFLLGAAIDA